MSSVVGTSWHSCLAHLRTAGVEAAADRRVGRRRHVAGEDDPLALVAADGVGHRHRRQQRLRVGVGGKVEHVVAGPDLDDLAEVHHGDAVAEVLDDGEVVGDEQDREAEAQLQVAQQVEDLRADRHVERRHRLVGDEEPRLDGERSGDADALALAAAELVREAPGEARVEADEVEHLGDARLALLLADAVGTQSLGDRVADRRPRVERRVRDPGRRPGCSCAAPAARARRGEEVLAVEVQRSLVGVEEAQEDARQRRLAAARLADEAEHLAVVDVEVDVVDGAHAALDAPERAAAQRERLDDPAGLDERPEVRRSAHLAVHVGLPVTTSSDRDGDLLDRRVAVQEAAHVRAVVELDERRRRLGAALHPLRAAVGEPAPRRRIDERRHPAGDHGQLVVAHADDRDRAEQAAGVRDAWGRRTAPRPAPPRRSGRRTSRRRGGPSRRRRRDRG